MGVTALDDEVTLPTLERLGARVPEDLDIVKVSGEWTQKFSKAMESGCVDSVVSLFIEDGFWRDMLAFTWEFRTFYRACTIKKFLQARLTKTKPTNIKLSAHKDQQPSKCSPSPELFWIQAALTFETNVGKCSGIVSLVPTANNEWKAFLFYSNLEEVGNTPDKVGVHRIIRSNVSWIDERAKEMAFEDIGPKVLVIGAGQAGLGVASRLKVKGIPCLVVDKIARVGDNWRNRYKTLCLHDSSWMAHMPYLNFPPTWPGFTPGQKYGDWLEFYAQMMDLNVWTSTEVQKVERDDNSDQWVVTLRKADGTIRVLQPKYVVMGLGFGEPSIPAIPGADTFKGTLMHAYSHREGSYGAGKKVVVIGSATAALFADNDIPIEIKDRISAATPTLVSKRMHQIGMKRVMEVDKDIHEGLKKAGFKLDFGIDGSGWLFLATLKLGGYYLDVGASQMIIDGKIKMKNGSVKSLTPKGVTFEDGSQLDADIIIYATGLSGIHSPIQRILGKELTSKLKPYGISNEGELQGAWRETGLKNLFVHIGNTRLCRFHSNHISLVIQAKEEGLFTDVYDVE
ncbi:hypothetical protein Clacol_003173 [Clathrus columnatus]|uniref:Flavin-containing monooxygenase n=1 Tax=Clathrus columnatus TaxID=1419009 RepID=A0AAV5A8H1_9AGAM|nr:hypothetical protein Clacol_003173 [Clathrus columnatus]